MLQEKFSTFLLRDAYRLLRGFELGGFVIYNCRFAIYNCVVEILPLRLRSGLNAFFAENDKLKNGRFE